MTNTTKEHELLRAAAAVLERAHNAVVDAAAAVVSYAVDVPHRGTATVPQREMDYLRMAVREWREAGEALVLLQRGGKC
jgi:hypothetical protein